MTETKGDVKAQFFFFKKRRPYKTTKDHIKPKKAKKDKKGQKGQKKVKRP